MGRDMGSLGDARPTMACDIEGERGGEMENGGELLKMAVDALCAVAVLLLLSAVLLLDKRQEVLGLGVGVFIEEALNVRLYAHLHLLACLATGVVDCTLTDVRLAQKGKVDGGDTPQIEREEEHVAGEVECGTMGKVGMFYAYDVILGDGTLGGLVDACIDGVEGLTVGGESFGDGLVVDGAQDAHIERCGVAAQVLVAQPGLVGKGELRRDHIKREVTTVTVAHEAVERLDIMGSRAVSAYLAKQVGLTAEEIEHGCLVATFLLEGGDHIVCRKLCNVLLQVVYHPFYLLPLPLQFALYIVQHTLALLTDAIGHGDSLLPFVPLKGTNEAVGHHLPDDSVVYHLII